MATTPVREAETAIQTEATEGSTRSVQDMYRPVLADRVPDAPTQRGDKSWVWWAEQLKRIKYGWRCPDDGHYISGYQYFYLNFVKIPRQDKLTQSITGWDSPYYRCNDDEIFMRLWNNRERPGLKGDISAKNLIKAKPRTIGWTQIEFLGVDMYHFLFIAGRDRYIGRGYPAETYLKAERGWFRSLYAEHIHPFFKTWNGKELEILDDNAYDFQVGRRVDGVKIIRNWMQYRLVPNETSAGVFKSMRLTKITAVEAGLWTGDSLGNFYSENKDCLGAADYQWGMMVIGGTSNAVINRSSNYQKMYFNAKDYKAVEHFTPKTKGLIGYIDLHTGKDKVEEAYAYVIGLRKSVEHNSQLLQKEKVENPLTPQECFEPSTSFAYDATALQAQINWVKSNGHDQLWVTGRMRDERDANNQLTGRVIFVGDKPGTPPKECGPWTVNRAGLPHHGIKGLHIAGIDDCYKDLKVGYKLRKRDSRNCMIIYRQPTTLTMNQDMPVAMYYDKLESSTATHEEFLKGMKCYDVQQCLYEYNHEGFITFLRDRQQLYRLWYVNDRAGLEIKGRVKAEVTALGHQYMANGRYQGITLLPLLKSMLGWGSDENDDIGSAFHCLLYLLHATKDRQLEADETDMVLNGLPTPKMDHRIRLGAHNAVNGQQQARNKKDYIRLNAGYSYSQSYDAYVN